MSGPPNVGRWRAINNRNEEEPECSQVAKHRSNAMSPRRDGTLNQDVKHDGNLSTLPWGRRAGERYFPRAMSDPIREERIGINSPESARCRLEGGSHTMDQEAHM